MEGLLNWRIASLATTEKPWACNGWLKISMRLDEACGCLMRPSQVRLKRSFLNAEGENIYYQERKFRILFPLRPSRSYQNHPYVLQCSQLVDISSKKSRFDAPSRKASTASTWGSFCFGQSWIDLCLGLPKGSTTSGKPVVKTILKEGLALPYRAGLQNHCLSLG